MCDLCTMIISHQDCALRKIKGSLVLWTCEIQVLSLRYQPPFRTVRARIAVALVVFIKTPINHIFFKSLIIPDYGFELTKTIYLIVFRNWNALCKSTRLYKSYSTPAGNKRKKTINTLIVFHVPSADGVDELNWLSSSGSSSWISERLALSETAFSLFWTFNSSSHFSCR